jgi:hypothetical protein
MPPNTPNQPAPIFGLPIQENRSAPELAYTALQDNQEVAPQAVVGTTGLRHASGFLNEEFISRLRGQPGVQFYREMWDNSAVIGAVMFTIQALLREIDWPVEAADDTPEAERWKEFLESCVEDMDHTWHDLISEIMSFLIFGWAWFEIVFKLRKGEHEDDPTINSQFSDGLWGIRKIEMRSQDTLWQWGFTRDGTLRGMIQLDTWNALGRGPVFIPVEKSLHFVTRHFKSNPEGFPLLRPVVGAYHYVKRMQELEAIGWSKDLVGMPVLEVPREMLMPTASPEYRQLLASLKTMMAQLQVDERSYAILPSSVNPDGSKSGFNLQLMQSGGRRTIDTSGAIQRYNLQVMQAFGADFLQIGQGKVGTQSLFEGKTNLFLLGLTHYLDIIETTVNRRLVPKIMKLNNVPRELWPKFRHGKLDKPDLAVLGVFLQQLGAAGLLSPNKNLEERVLEMADLPPPNEDDMAVYEDLSRPTPSQGKDLAAGLMSDDQTKTILDVNAAVAGKKLGYKAAAKLLAARLGMDESNASQFLEEVVQEPPPPPPVAGVPGKMKPPVMPQAEQQ